MTHNPPTATKEPPWHSAFPAPRSTAQSISRDQVRSMLLQHQKPTKEAESGDSGAGKDFVLIDLRRNDHEGGTIHTSVNLPAQSLYPSIPTLYTLFKAAGVKKVIWYCGSSQGRGPRAAGWFADHVEDQQSSKQADGSATAITSLVLSGGIKGWVAGGSDFTKLMDGYVAEKWTED